jgi:hypothetical protein
LKYCGKTIGIGKEGHGDKSVATNEIKLIDILTEIGTQYFRVF